MYDFTDIFTLVFTFVIVKNAKQITKDKDAMGRDSAFFYHFSFVLKNIAQYLFRIFHNTALTEVIHAESVENYEKKTLELISYVSVFFPL